MGRYYTGTISGKFWFSIQSSDDASNFKPSYYEPGPCSYCASKNECTCEEDCDCENECYNISYEFDQDDLEFVVNKLKDIENELGQEIMQNLQIDISKKICFEYELDWNFVDLQTREKQELIARWSLGKQIQSALETIGECIFDCEC